ncbi:MAG: tetratricopeptide repeat protein [Chloroflexota bacterium]
MDQEPEVESSDGGESEDATRGSDADRATAVIDRAEHLVGEGRTDEAEAIYHAAFESGLHGVFVAYADLLTAQPSRWIDAEQLYRRGIEAGIVEAHNELGNLLIDMGRQREAEAQYRAGLELGDLLVLRNLGQLLTELGHFAEAENYLRGAISCDDPEAYRDRGDLYAKVGLYHNAERDYQTAIAAGVENVNLDYGNLLCEELQRPREAEAQFLLAIEAGEPQAYHSLALLYAEMGRPDDAEKQYRSAIRENVEEALTDFGIFLAGQGRFGEAEEAFEEAIAGGDEGAHDVYAGLLLELNRDEGALEHLLRAVELDPSEPGNAALLAYAAGRRGWRLDPEDEAEAEAAEAAGEGEEHA